MSRQALRQYWTGLRSPPGELDGTPNASTIYRGPGWEVRFLPYKRKYPKLPKGLRRSITGSAGPGYELYIFARSLIRAKYVASLLFAARSLVEGTPVDHMILGWEPFPAIPMHDRELNSLPPGLREDLIQKRAQHDFYMETFGFFDVAEVACRLARRRNFQNAAFKYLLSGYLIRIHHMDLRPGEKEAKEFRSESPMDWVWFSQSLFSAYGVIEELNLTPKASPNRPSILPTGEWNPPVRTDLEARLHKIGIDPNQTFYWHARGKPSRLEKKAAARITTSQPTQWTGGDIRDMKLLYIDAINIASYLRSNVTAHIGDISNLTALDVANVQHLARMLLLQAIRFHFWKAVA